jgi:uncharacterized protein YdhG (YjbR/CyaY superfamily)
MLAPPEKPRTKAKLSTVDDYLSTLSEDQRAALQGLRQAIHAAAPGAGERISYRIPGFHLNGKCFMWIGAAAHHCAIYGVSVTDIDELKGYDTSGKGTIRFKPNEPPPASLVRKLVKAQISNLAAKETRP